MGCPGCLLDFASAPCCVFFQSCACISDWGLAIEHLSHTISNQNNKIPD